MIYCIEQGFIHPRYIIRIIFFVLEVILQSLERRNYGKMRQWHEQRNMSQDEQMQGIEKKCHDLSLLISLRTSSLLIMYEASMPGSERHPAGASSAHSRYVPSSSHGVEWRGQGNGH